jgi:hypothetical protein
MSAEATSAGHGLSARLDGRNQVRVAFPPGVYRSLTEGAAGRELAQVARALWVRRTASHQDMLRREFGADAPYEVPPSTAADHEFDRLLATLVAEGFSADGRIRVATRGLAQWKVALAPGTLRSLREIEFERGVNEAATALAKNRAERVAELRDRVYGPSPVVAATSQAPPAAR